MSRCVATVPLLFQWVTKSGGSSVRHGCDIDGGESSADNANGFGASPSRRPAPGMIRETQLIIHEEQQLNPVAGRDFRRTFESSAMQLDFYQGVEDSSLRMAVKAGTGLPGHVDPEDWKSMTVDDIELAAWGDEILADIKDHGFSFYKLVPPP